MQQRALSRIALHLIQIQCYSTHYAVHLTGVVSDASYCTPVVGEYQTSLLCRISSVGKSSRRASYALSQPASQFRQLTKIMGRLRSSTLLSALIVYRITVGRLCQLVQAELSHVTLRSQGHNAVYPCLLYFTGVLKLCLAAASGCRGLEACARLGDQPKVRKQRSGPVKASARRAFVTHVHVHGSHLVSAMSDGILGPMCMHVCADYSRTDRLQPYLMRCLCFVWLTLRDLIRSPYELSYLHKKHGKHGGGDTECDTLEFRQSLLTMIKEMPLIGLFEDIRGQTK